MKKYLLIMMLLPVVGCEKEPVDPKKEYNYIKPVPTCNDLADEGKYEVWDSTLIYHQGIRNTPELNLIDTLYITRRLLDNNSNVQMRLVCKAKVPVIMYAYVVEDTAATRQWTMDGGATSPTTDAAIDMYKSLDYFYNNNGCHRLFYVVKDAEDKIVTKGHYDIEVAW